MYPANTIALKDKELNIYLAKTVAFAMREAEHAPRKDRCI